MFIPKGVPHGPLTWKKVNRPHLQMVVMPGAGTLKQSNPAGYLPEEDRLSQAQRLPDGPGE